MLSVSSALLVLDLASYSFYETKGTRRGPLKTSVTLHILCFLLVPMYKLLVILGKADASTYTQGPTVCSLWSAHVLLHPCSSLFPTSSKFSTFLDPSHQPTNLLFLHFKRKNNLLMPLLSSLPHICLHLFKEFLEKLYEFSPNSFFSFSFETTLKRQLLSSCCENYLFNGGLLLLCPWSVVSSHFVLSAALETVFYSCFLITHFSLGFYFLDFSFSLLAAAFLFFIWSLFIIIISKHWHALGLSSWTSSLFYQNKDLC